YAVHLTVDGVHVHEALDERAGVDQVGDGQDLARGDDARRRLTRDVEDVGSSAGGEGVDQHLVVVGLDGLVLDGDAFGCQLGADHFVEQALYDGGVGPPVPHHPDHRLRVGCADHQGQQYGCD